MRTRTFDEIKNEVFGSVGTPERDKLEHELHAFSCGAENT